MKNLFIDSGLGAGRSRWGNSRRHTRGVDLIPHIELPHGTDQWVITDICLLNTSLKGLEVSDQEARRAILECAAHFIGKPYEAWQNDYFVGFDPDPYGYHPNIAEFLDISEELDMVIEETEPSNVADMLKGYLSGLRTIFCEYVADTTYRKPAIATQVYEGFVYRNPNGRFLCYRSQQTHTGTHRSVDWVDSVEEATINPVVPQFMRGQIADAVKVQVREQRRVTLLENSGGAGK
jgi:hypothetical protein